MRNLGSAANRVLRRLVGYEIRPITRDPSFRARRNLVSTKGKCIEFIGPAGVGKTTLLNQALHLISGDWYSRNDLASARLDRTPDLIDERVHWNLLVEKLQSLEAGNYSGMQKLQLMHYFSKVLVNDVALRYANSTKGFFLDEGLCHNFSKQLEALGETDFAHMMSGRALVLVKQRDDTTVARQIRERAMAGGGMVTHHHGRTADELAAAAKDSKIRLEAFAVRAEAAGVPLRIIHTEDPMDQKIEAVIEFERRLLRGTPETI